MRKQKNNDTIEQVAKTTVIKTLTFAQHIGQFSKLLAFIFVSLYALTWLVYLGIVIKIYIDTNTFQNDVLDYILSPTMVIIGFYFGSKVCENISQGVCNTYLKKLNKELGIEEQEE